MSGATKQGETQAAAQQQQPIQLWKAPALVQDELVDTGMNLQPKDVELLDEFEDLWQQFLQTNPHVLPPGKKGKRVEGVWHKEPGFLREKF